VVNLKHNDYSAAPMTNGHPLPHSNGKVPRHTGRWGHGAVVRPSALSDIADNVLSLTGLSFAQP